MDLLDQVRAETAANPKWFGVLVAMGADDQGVSMDLVNRLWAKAGEALSLAMDESEPSARREGYRRTGETMRDVVVSLALAGQRFVNDCRAMAAVERAGARA